MNKRLHACLANDWRAISIRPTEDMERIAKTLPKPALVTERTKSPMKIPISTRSF